MWLRDGDELVMSFERNADPEAIRRFGRVPIDSDLPGPEVMRTGEAIFVASREDRDQRWPAIAGTPSPSEAMVVLPLEAAGRSHGVVSFGFGMPRTFSDEGRLAFLTVADQCATAIDRALLYEATHSDARANHLLARISGAIGASRDWEQLARDAVAACTDDFVDSCVVFVREGHLIRRVAVSSRTYGSAFEGLVGRFPTPISAPAPNAIVIRTGEEMELPSLTPEIIAAFSASPEYVEQIRSIKLGEGWILPLRAGSVTFGAMIFAAAPDDGDARRCFGVGPRCRRPDR